MKLSGFFHKNHIPQKIAHDPKWTDLVFREGLFLKRKRFTAGKTGVLTSKLYLPLKFKGKGLVRVRMVREPFGKEPSDPTDYDERILDDSISDGFARLSLGGPIATASEKGRKYKWQAQVLGDVEASTTGTHYAEWLIL